MMTNNDTVFERFAQNDVGHRNSTGSVTSRRAANGDALLFSYDALISRIDSDSGSIQVFEDWIDYSKTTAIHFGSAKRHLEREGHSWTVISTGRPENTLRDSVEIDTDGVAELEEVA